jgi:biotin transport system substrate-specific component
MSSGAAPLASPSTLAGSLWPARDDARLSALRAAVLMLFGTGLLALSAKIQVPFYPVPMTMQTLVVLVIGAAYGWRLGGATVGLYLVEGLLGLPVFAGAAAGPAYMAGPTGGFLIGFVVAAMMTGYVAERSRSLLVTVLAMAVAHAVLLAFGFAWLATLMPFAKAWAVGVAPFLLGTAVKIALAAALMQVAWNALRSR